VLWVALYAAWTLAAAAGVIAALAGFTSGAWLVVGFLALYLAARIVVAGAVYRRTMRREWPHVEPIPFDDD
jgi:hypothetical protein